MQDDISILFLDHSTQPGGAELALRRLVDLAPRDGSSVVMTPVGDPGIFARPDRFEHAMVGPSQQPGAATGMGILRNIGFIRDILHQAISIRRSRQYMAAKLVVANTSRSAIYAWLASIGTRKTTVLYLRDEVSPSSLGSIGFMAFRLSLRSATAVIANSHYTLSTALPFLRPGAPTMVTPSPVGMIAKPRGERRIGAVSRIGMVARIDSWKGHALLIRAFARAFPDSDVELHLAGGPLFGGEALLFDLQDVARTAGVGSRVIFRGHVQDVTTFIDEMDICVQSSLRPEPLGQNVLQYLLRRCPAIVSDRGGPAEWVEENVNGILFAEGDEDDLARALIDLSADIELRDRIALRLPVLVPSDEEIAAEIFEFLSVGTTLQESVT